MEPTEKELEDRLRELGTRLASPPSDVDELLCLLDQTEIYLSRVEQSPSTSMSDALCPTMNSLITKEFLNHPEADVKVYVAACINEIMRVTAPDAPYNDDLMKEIFAMIVDAFEKLDDMSGCSYCKRVSILEIMAKVRSCVVMLDLECDDLILRMFENFLKSIRTDHPINVFSSMETIMTLILEESEDISQELLSCLLSNVQKSKKGVMPVVRRLAEKVISNCYMKLKPYIVAAVQSIGTSLSDYSDIVASISQDSSVALEKNEADGNKLSEKAVSDALPQETEKLDKPVNYLEEVGAFSDKARKVLSNGVVPLGNGNAVVDPISPKLKPENSFSSEQCRNGVPSGEHNSLGSITEKPGNELNFQSVEAKLSSVQLTDASDSSLVDDDKEVSAPPSRRAGWKKEIQSLKSDGASDMVPETEVFLEGEREAELQPLEGLDGDNSCINSAAPTYKPPVSGLPMRKRVTNSEFSEKRSTSHKPVPSAGQKKMSGLTTVKKEDPPAIASIHKDHFLVSVSDGKPSQDSTKKSLADNASAELAVAGVCDGKSLRKEKMETESLVADANTFENQGKPNTNRPEPLDVTDKDLSAEPCLKEMMASSKASREEHNDHNRWVKFAGGNLKKKSRRKAPRLYNLYLEIIGREIEVWWPDDKKFYKGVIDAFDPVTEKHRVVYDDGDVEILFLRNERWNYVDSKNFEKELENDVASPESSLQVPRKKRRRVSSGKRKANRKRGIIGRKSKDMAIQQSGDGNSTVKSRDSTIETTSELATSLYEKTPESLVREETKLEEPSHINNLDKTPDDTSIIKDNILASGGDKSVIRSRGRPKGDSLGKKSNTLQKDEGTEIESHQTKNSLDETLVGAVTSTGAKLDGKSKDRRESALKSRVNPIGETLKSSRILNEETLKTTSNYDKEIKIESYQTKDSDNTVPYTTAAFKHGLIIDTDQNLKGKETLKLDNMASEDPKGRRKRKRTVTTIDTNVSAIENLDDLSQSSSAKTNQRRRK